MRYKIRYTFEEELEYASKEDAEQECNQAAKAIAIAEGLTVVEVSVEEISDPVVEIEDHA